MSGLTLDTHKKIMYKTFSPLLHVKLDNLENLFIDFIGDIAREKIEGRNITIKDCCISKKYYGLIYENCDIVEH